MHVCICVYNTSLLCFVTLNYVIMNVCCQGVGVWWNGQLVACGAWPDAGMGLDSNEIISWVRSRMISVPNYKKAFIVTTSENFH